MKKVKNGLSNSIRNFKWHNPNSYNAFDAALCYLLVLVSFFLVSLSFSYILKAINNYVSFDYYTLMVISIVLGQLPITIVGLCFMKVKKVDFLKGSGFRFKFNWVDILFAAVLTIGLYFLIAPTHLTFADDLYMFKYGMSYEDYTLLKTGITAETSGSSFLALLLVFVLIPCLPAIFEEFVFRGIILRGFSEFGTVFAVFASSICFALMHGSVEQIILQFIIGVFIAAVVLLTKNFLLGTIMHFTNNLFSSIFAIYISIQVISFNDEKLFYLYEAFSIVIGVIFTIIGVMYFGKMALVKYKNKALNKAPNAKFYDVEYSCITTEKTLDNEYDAVEIDNLNSFDYNGKDFYFLKKNTFYKFNKKSNFAATIIILGFALVFAIVSIIYSFFR